MKQVALLRGINVGGKNLVSMKDLAAVFANAGCENVSTYIQSGNVIFESPGKPPDKLAGTLASSIQERFGCHVPVILRTQAELEAVISSNPFRNEQTTQEMLHVYFLDNFPAPERVAQLDQRRSPGDAFAVSGREIFLRLPNGMGRTKLTNAYFDSKLALTCTARNWRTIAKLRDLMSP